MAAAVVYRVVLSQGLITIALKVSADRNSHQGVWKVYVRTNGGSLHFGCNLKLYFFKLSQHNHVFLFSDKIRLISLRKNPENNKFLSP